MNRRMIKLFCIVVCIVFCSQTSYACPWTRHDFEVWNLESQKRILLADTEEGGMREMPFQYDYSSKVLYTYQGMLDERKGRVISTIIRSYDLDSGAVRRRFYVPVERYVRGWQGVVVDNKLLLLGCGNSHTNCFHRGRGNRLLVLDLNASLNDQVIADVNLGEKRVIFRIDPLSESDFCIGGFDTESERYFIENYDGRKFSLKKHIDFPAEWAKDAYDMEWLKKGGISEFSLHLWINVDISVSPTRSMVSVNHGKDLWLFDAQLECIGQKDLTSDEFAAFKDLHPSLEWVGLDVFVLYNHDTGAWAEYDLSDKKIKGSGRISLKKKDDERERLAQVVGQRRFCIRGDISFFGSIKRRVCFVDVGGEERNLRKMSGKPIAFYCPPDIVVVNRL